jgi:general secretion pathway protein A
MYLEHFGLKEPPFSITPDPRFVFLSERHRDALAHLLFGIGQGGGGGFVQLTGEVGTGKTTLCRLLLEQVPENTRVALVLNPRLTPVELLETICEELHLDLAPLDASGKRGSLKSLVDVLNRYLLDAYAQGLRVVLIIDEAQDLSIDALEQVRLLTNLETDTQKLLQILLLGQPELRTLLGREDLRQLAQRITARFHLTPLDAIETERYLRHRHAIAGGLHLPFSRAAIKRLHAHSGGVPRLINVIAERSLLAGYARDQTRLDGNIVDQAAREAMPARMPRTEWFVPSLVALSLVILLLAGLVVSRTPSALPANLARRAVAATITPTPAPVAPTPRVPPPVLDFDGLSQRIVSSSVDPSTAWRALLSAWNLPTADSDVAIAMHCAASLATDVFCLHARGSLDALATIGRPVLLRLRAGHRDAWALLLGVDAMHVRLQLDGGVFDLPRVALQRVWNGDYAAIWRQLSDPTATSTAAQLRALQASHGIVADGVPGPETRFALSSDGHGPTLSKDLR